MALIINLLDLALFFIGLALLLLVFIERGFHAYIPAVREHGVAVTLIGVIAIFLSVAMIFGVINVGTTPQTNEIVKTPGPLYSISYTLGDFQAGSAASSTATTVTLADKLATINGQNGVEATIATYNGGDILMGTDHNATIGTVAFTVTLYRTDTINQNLTFSVSLTNIGTVVNSTSGKTYTVVLQNTGGQYEVYFNNNTQVANVYVHWINVGQTTTFYVSFNVGSSMVDSMQVYGVETVDLNILYGSQNLNIPVELIRTS